MQQYSAIFDRMHASTAHQQPGAPPLSHGTKVIVVSMPGEPHLVGKTPTLHTVFEFEAELTECR